MIELLNDQKECDRQFRKWVDALLDASTKIARGWVINGTGVVFSNYGRGNTHDIEDQVMLGFDASLKNGIVKLVKPDTSQKDLGKATGIGRENGQYILLRQGRLKANHISDEIIKEFRTLSGLNPVPLSVEGKISEREWYVVARLDADPSTIAKQTVAFTVGCTQARTKAGKTPDEKYKEAVGEEPFKLGLDEKGRVTKVTTIGGTKEVEALQGYVSEALKEIMKDKLQKPKKRRYEVDALIATAKLLIEIKTGVAAHNIYEAVGQLTLYPSLISLPADLRKILLLPDEPNLAPPMAAALEAAQIGVYFYSVGREGEVPKIAFSDAFLELCHG